MPDKGNKVETSTLTAIPFDDIETTRETHQWITQTATTLPPTVAQQLSNVKWKECQPHSRARSGIMKTEFARICDQ